MKMKYLALIGFLCIMVGSVSGTTMSVSDIEYDSNSQFFDGKVLAVEMIADDSTESLEADIPASEISGAVEGETSQSIEIDITENSRSVEYGLREDPGAIDITDGTTVHAEGFSSQTEVNDWAAENCVGGVYAYKQTRYIVSEYAGWCVAETSKVGTVGEFREDSTSPRSQFEVTYQLNVEGQPTESVTLSNSEVGDGVQANLGQHAKVEWLGSYDLSTSPEGTSEGAAALHSNGFTGNWRVIDEDKYTDYTNYINYNLENDLVQWANGDKSEGEVQDTYTGYVNSASSPYSTHPLGQARTVDGSLNSGVLEYTPESQLFHPSFMVYIDAGEDGYLTINRPTGVPSIVDSSGGEAGEFDSGTVTMTAENSGSYEGEFSARISSCSEGFTFDSDPRGANLGPGESTEFEFQVGFDSGSYEEKEISGSCTVELSEDSTGETVSTSVDMTGVQETECDEGKRQPGVQDGEEVILECTDGFSQEVVEVCDTNSEGQELTTGMKNGEWSCVPKDSPPVVDPDPCQENVLGLQFTNPVCSISDAWDNTTGFLGQISLIVDVLVTSVAGLLAFGVSKKYIPEYSGIEDRRVVLGVSLALTALAALLVYQLISNVVVKILILVVAVVLGYLKASVPGL
jgi:hypothetical protein